MRLLLVINSNLGIGPILRRFGDMVAYLKVEKIAKNRQFVPTPVSYRPRSG